MAETADQDDDMDMAEEEMPRPRDAITTARMSDNEEMAFAELDLDERCKSVLNDLSKEARHWDDAVGNPNIRPLEVYKKIGLLERSTRDKVAPTLLHILAKDYKKSYAEYPPAILQTVVAYLLDHMDRSQAESGEDDDEAPGEPILMLAHTYDNIKFIDLIKECRPDKFRDLLSVQDSKGQNFLHLVYAVPKTFQKRAPNLNDVRKKTMELAQKYVADAPPKALVAQDKNGNSPIHYAAAYRQCWGRGEWYVEIFRAMVLKASSIEGRGDMNNADESPILYCERTRKEFKEAQQQREERKAAEKQQQQQQQQTSTAPPLEPAAAKGGSVERKPKMRAWNASDDREMIARGRDRDDMPIKRPVRTPTSLWERSVRFENDDDLEHRPSAGPFPADRSEPPPSMDGQAIVAPSLGSIAYRSRSQPKAPTRMAGAGVSRVDNQPSAPKKDPDKPVNDILHFLVLHYIRERTDLEARELIYGKYASDKNLYFDALSLRYKGAADVTDLLTRMSVGGFGQVLAYVYLPTILHSRDGEAPMTKTKSYAMNKSVARDHPDTAENPKIGRSCLVSVFRKLYDAGVRKILRLTVEDMEAPSHTDAAIEECLKGRHLLTHTADPERVISVETWDWRKPDLSIDVIAFAAPDVEHVHLYWSGNQTVLRGWACSEGLPRLYHTERKLKTVTVDVAPGLEARDRMDKMLSRFKTEIDNSTNKSVEVKFIYRMSGLFNKLDHKSRRSEGSTAEGPQQHKWITDMEKFRSALVGVHTELGKLSPPIRPKRVKVALIDDGVDLSDLDRYNGIVEATGVSYHYARTGQGQGQAESGRPWHESSGGHGTIMANMIVRINPWALLCVMKLQDGRNKDGSRTIFAASAAEAIRGAVGRGVDIISMSWTVHGKIAEAVAKTTTGGAASAAAAAAAAPPTTDETDAIKKLECAIDEAKKANILMFCSASDDIRAGGLDALPYRQSPESIIRIGAALAHGQRDALSEDVRHIDFFFPGNQVAEAWNPRSAGAVKYHDGSSVATALAAGLASLIIYCYNVVRSYHQSPGDFERYYPSVENLKQCDGMKRAFQNIDSDSWEDKKYLPVWDLFGPAATDISKMEGQKKLERLDDLVQKLCIKVKR